MAPAMALHSATAFGCALPGRPAPPVVSWAAPRGVVCAAFRHGSDQDGPSSSSVPDAVPVVAADADWRSFRAQLVASTSGAATSAASQKEDEVWAHTLTSPERGCLLLASPLSFTTNQTYFHEAVILIFAHDASGTAGLILNKPTQHRIGDLEGTLQPEFAPCSLYIGGDVDPRSVNLLHGVPNCANALEVLPGVHLGGFDGVARALTEGSVAPDQVKILTRYAGWGPGQLEAEVRRGVWYVAAASKHLVLQPSAAGGGGSMWHAAMQLLGAEHAQLSEAVREQFRPDIMGAWAPAAGTQQAEQGEQGSGGTNGSDPESWKGNGI